MLLNEIQDRIDGKTELRANWFNVFGSDAFYFMIVKCWTEDHTYNVAFVIDAPSSCSSRNLKIFFGVQRAKIKAIILSQSIKADSFCGHINSYRKCFCGVQNTNQALGEEFFNSFFHDRKQSGMVKGNTLR